MVPDSIPVDPCPITIFRVFLTKGFYRVLRLRLPIPVLAERVAQDFIVSMEIYSTWLYFASKGSSGSIVQAANSEYLVRLVCDYHPPIFPQMALLINCKLRRSQSSLHTARRCIPNVPTYISIDHEHQNGTINSSLVGVIIGDWKFYNHQGLCFNSKRSIRVGLMDITCGLMISQDRNLIRLFGAMPRIRTPPSTVTCIVLRALSTYNTPRNGNNPNSQSYICNEYTNTLLRYPDTNQDIISVKMMPIEYELNYSISYQIINKHTGFYDKIYVQNHVLIYQYLSGAPISISIKMREDRARKRSEVKLRRALNENIDKYYVYIANISKTPYSCNSYQKKKNNLILEGVKNCLAVHSVTVVSSIMIKMKIIKEDTLYLPKKGKWSQFLVKNMDEPELNIRMIENDELASQISLKKIECHYKPFLRSRILLPLLGKTKYLSLETLIGLSLDISLSHYSQLNLYYIQKQDIMFEVNKDYYYYSYSYYYYYYYYLLSTITTTTTTTATTTLILILNFSDANAH
ncbi:hypothetical protein H8356DRAFT_1357286 [Neocallimastix lanati (nom. inval.)]|nr:hypothetical protein H8356DRAFT_1357286 [Neocallimastix sp. JGI-2020a]